MEIITREKIKNIYKTLPRLNCGLCGYGNCGQFARAVAEGKASPFACEQNPWAGYKISEIIGVKAPASGFRYGDYGPVLAQRAGPASSPELLRKDLGELHKRVDDILTRLEKLAKN